MPNRLSNRKKIGTIIGAIGLAFWLAFIGLFLHYGATRPKRPQTDIGRIYEINNHGTLAYLTWPEAERLWGLCGSAIVIFIIGMILSQKR